MTRTPQQQKAITALAKNLCVDAAAGSGKTSVLIERIIHLIEIKRASLDEIVAITFTEAAAAEMKMRLRKAFRQKAPHDDPAEMSRWREMERWVENARVSTIHSFCASLLRDNALRIGMDPDFTVLADAESVLLRGEVVTDALHDLLDRGDPAALRAATELGAPRLINELNRMLNKRRLLEIIGREHPLDDPNELMDHWREQVKRADDEFFLSLANAPEVRRFHEQLLAFDGKCLAANDGRELARREMLNALDTILADVGWVKWNEVEWNPPEVGSAYASPTLRHHGKWVQAVRESLKKVAELNFRTPSSSVKNWDCKETLEALKDLENEVRKFAADALPDAPNETIERQAAQLTCDVFATYQKVNEAFRAAKAARAGLDFDDLMAMALAVLRDNEEVRGRAARGIRFLLIDEFQDTDSTQLEIARLIADHPEGPDLFIVGDAKQSIYDFRGAEVEVFQQEKKAADEMVILGKNFRTVPDIMGFINDVFVRTGLLHAVEPMYPPLETFREPVGACRVEFLIPPEDEESARDDYRALEADLIAAHLKQMVEGPDPAPIWDEALKSMRPAQFGDVALLFRATTSVYLYEQSLRKNGIPYNVVAGAGFYQRQEILDIKNLLAVLVDPWDEMALLGFLRGPLCGLSDDSLVRLAMRQPLASAFYSRAVPEGFRQTANLRGAHELLADLRARGQMTLPAFLRHVLDVTGYEAIALSQFLGVQKASNVRKLVDLAEDFARTSPPNLAGFVHYLDTVALEEIREGDAVVQSAGSGTVTLMTIHKAKGLEFPIVVVPDISRDRKGPDNGDVETHRRLGIAARTMDEYGDPAKPAIYAAIHREQKAKSDAEHARVFYVAMTRARDWLLFSGCPNAGKKSWMKVLDDHYGLLEKADGETLSGEGWKAVVRRTSAGEVQSLRHCEESSTKQSPQLLSAMAGIASSRTPRNDAGAPSAKPGNEVSVSLQDLELRAAPITRVQQARKTFSVSEVLDCMMHVPDPEEQWAGVSNTRSHEGYATYALQRGTLVHRMFEVWDFTSEPPIESLLRREFPECFEMDNMDAYLREVADRFAQSPLGKRVMAAAQKGPIEREAPFLLRMDDAFVSGVIDVFLPDGTIVDYKTGKVHADLHDRYESQLRLYALAARNLSKTSPTSAWLFYTDSGEEYQIAIDEDALDATHAKTREAIRNLKTTI